MVSAYATHDNHGAIDDERYIAFFIASGFPFLLYTSDYSAARIRQKCPISAEYLKVLGRDKFSVSFNERVIFTGYSEAALILFLVKNIFYRPRLILVATNNFSRQRIRKFRFLLRVFLGVINPFLDRIVLHTGFEKGLVTSLYPKITEKLYVKRHHLMTPRDHVCSSPGTAKIISYFGPDKRDKPLLPFLTLIQADTAREFTYRLYNIQRDTLRRFLPDLDDRDNVEVFEGWQDHDSYLKAVKSSTFIFLSHNKSFEGKLSGNLCDCIALRVPYIARSMEPMVAYADSFGELGFLYEFDEPNWAYRFLQEHDDLKRSKMLDNLERVGAAHSRDAIDRDLANCFLK